MNTAKLYTATRNACKMCTPLGAALVFHGIEGAIPLLHGSQGCSTYMRRYLISHFKEPVDIASSNFSEETAIFGGGANLKQAIENIIRQYSPEMIGIATTCLSETIGDDVPMILQGMDYSENGPILVHVSTPSYTGTHMDGFHHAVRSVADQCTRAASPVTRKPRTRKRINLFPGMMSNEDLRHLKEIFSDMNMGLTLLPDYSERLEGPSWSEYHAIQKGGTPIKDIREMGSAMASIEFGTVLSILSGKGEKTAGSVLKDKFGIPFFSPGIPIGVKAVDHFFSVIEEATSTPMPEKYQRQRGHLVDAYVDGNKYISRKKAVVYGEEDFVTAIAGFLAEIGVIPVLCASGGSSGVLKQALDKVLPQNIRSQVRVHQGMDFTRMEEAAKPLSPDFVIGNSKGYPMSRNLGIPLIRTGFPVHDRVGGARIFHIGYKGTQNLFDTIVNTLLQRRQDESTIGYAYM
jgi:nitrogenase molybdenum-iron protein NifN